MQEGSKKKKSRTRGVKKRHQLILVVVKEVLLFLLHILCLSLSLPFLFFVISFLHETRTGRKKKGTKGQKLVHVTWVASSDPQTSFICKLFALVCSKNNSPTFVWTIIPSIDDVSWELEFLSFLVVGKEQSWSRNVLEMFQNKLVIFIHWLTEETGLLTQWQLEWKFVCARIS